MQSVWKKPGKCRKICEWAINARNNARNNAMSYNYDRIDLRVDVAFCRLSKTTLLSFASYSYFKSEHLSFIIT